MAKTARASTRYRAGSRYFPVVLSASGIATPRRWHLPQAPALLTMTAGLPPKKSKSGFAPLAWAPLMTLFRSDENGFFMHPVQDKPTAIRELLQR